MVHHLAFTFLRHGITKENEEKRYIGFTDVPVTEQEMKRLREADIRLGSYPDLIVTSDLLRCRQTCDMLFGNMSIPIYEMREWREINFGDWEGKTFAELKEVKEYSEWLESPFSVAPPNGEHYRDFQQRVEQALTQTIKLAEQHAVSHILVITHGGPIRYLLEQYAPLERPFWEWLVPFGGGFTLQSTIERWKERKRCISLSEVPFKGNGNGCAAITS
ncbi:alpha-ribazole phosphatase [Anoxybacillus tepidamans]|uniref:Alpha-ribazole phosphatase n=1 Tax=Anoxybacteroides tepidamans TaxID=265948 RepID=A0A7W8IMY0_9BACL|nr:histidine phosphatase family protein [Anoxybacillus tepidamans]MBB5323462.1 alpha-ribazole phosphatase [Anoxybacillus tepidamans]